MSEYKILYEYHGYSENFGIFNALKIDLNNFLKKRENIHKTFTSYCTSYD